MLRVLSPFATEEIVTGRCFRKTLEGHLQPRPEIAATYKRPPVAKNPQVCSCLGEEKPCFTFFI